MNAETPSQNPFMDRRKYFRLAETLIIRCARLSLPPAAVPVEPHWLASTVDISEGGLLMRSPERLRVGEGLEIVLDLGRGEAPLTLRGNVVRYHAVMYDKIFYVPIAFGPTDAESRERLRSHITRAAERR